MDDWPPEALLDYVLCRRFDQRLGSFEDGWDPERILRDCGFVSIVDCESVLAFGDAVDGDPGDIVMRVAFNDGRRGGSREECLIPLPQGRTCLAQLRAMVQAELMVSGNHHWGDQFDVQNLSNALNLGILMCCNSLQLGGRQCFYNIGSQRENFPFWVCLWWREPTHFRLAQFAYQQSPAPVGDEVLSPAFRCFWRDADLPAVLRDHYRLCNRLAN